jgi:hypothetical protein
MYKLDPGCMELTRWTGWIFFGSFNSQVFDRFPPSTAAIQCNAVLKFKNSSYFLTQKRFFGLVLIDKGCGFDLPTVQCVNFKCIWVNVFFIFLYDLNARVKDDI